MFKILIVGLMALSFNALGDQAPTENISVGNVRFEHALWDGMPISFVVPVGQERILHFDSSVSLDNRNANLTSDKLSIMNNNGFLYIKAKKPFAPIRVPFVLKDSGTVVLVDLSASKKATDIAPVQVALQEKIGQGKGIKKNATPQYVGYIQLIRYAIQNLYSPKRLIEGNLSINRAPMYTTKSLNISRFPGTLALPLASWQGTDLYVTAVLVKNIDKAPVKLDPRTLRGKWLAASFYPSNYLTRSGTLNDRTTVFLVSSRPFNFALKSAKGFGNV